MLFNANDFDGIAAPACARRVNGHLCGDPLRDDGSCAACETESCQSCGAVVAPGVLTPVTDEGETLRCCPACGGSAAPLPSNAVEALQWGVAMALGERDDDASDPFEDEPEDATVETAVETMSETVYGRKAAA